ncbi:RsfA family transcriptional regulator [Natribacillus halophilus]|uniref:Transcription factor, RsfA family n=1 Tax=Natribacillus halophilus TaxID=549003 RepID=A0A1G8ME28_9BACI|nr:RsfA family transcriptional regulator [Natribacillus halophilus]SDI66203.1 transcription factor, RsfA family [Natribacillus halophilus]
MSALRQDAWNEEEDLILAEVVLKHIREGSTQLKAFEEVGRRLERTSAACGFRWNATIRKKYDEAVKMARQQKKKTRREPEDSGTEASSAPSTGQAYAEADIGLADVIAYLKELQKKEDATSSLQTALANEREEKQTLASQVETLQQELESVRNDYKSFLSLLDKARSWQGKQES